MKNLFFILMAAILLVSCNSSTSSDSGNSSVDDKKFVSKQTDGKWTTDFATAQELKGMRNTIENFTLLNKKKFENLNAYQEFGELMQMHADRVTTYCQLDPDTKNLLCKKLDKIKSEVKTLQGDDMEASKVALQRINSHLAEIDSSFSFMN